MALEKFKSTAQTSTTTLLPTSGAHSLTQAASLITAQTSLIARLRHVGSTGVDLTLNAIPSGWAILVDGFSDNGSNSRVYEALLYRRGDGTFNSIPQLTWKNAGSTSSVQLVVWDTPDLTKNFVAGTANTNAGNRTSVSGIFTSTVTDDANVVAIIDVAVGSTFGVTPTGTNGFTISQGGSTNSNGWAEKLIATSGTTIGSSSVAWTGGSNTLAVALPYLVYTNAVNNPPTVDAGVNQNVAGGATVNLHAVGNDDVGLAGYSWGWDPTSPATTTYTGGSTADATITAGTAPKLYIHKVTVTDNGTPALTGSDTVETRVPVSGSTAVTTLAMDGTNVVGTMTRVGAATTDGAALADASDATYIESGTVSATEQSERYRVEPSMLRASGQITPVRLGSDTGTVTAKVRLYEGTVLRETFTISGVTSTPTDYTLTVTSPGAITDWGNLWLEVGFTS